MGAGFGILSIGPANTAHSGFPHLGDFLKEPACDFSRRIISINEDGKAG